MGGCSGHFKSQVHDAMASFWYRMNPNLVKGINNIIIYNLRKTIINHLFWEWFIQPIYIYLWWNWGWWFDYWESIMCFCFMCFSLQVVHKDRRFLLCWLCDTSLKKRKVSSGLFPFSILYLLRNGWMVSHSMFSSSEHSARDTCLSYYVHVPESMSAKPYRVTFTNSKALYFCVNWTLAVRNSSCGGWSDLRIVWTYHTNVCVCVADIFLVNIVHDFTYRRHWFQFASMFPKMFIMIAL